MTALNTQTGLQPDLVPDHEWLEKRMLAIEEKSIKWLADDNDFTTIYQVLGELPDAYKSLGAAWQISLGLESLKKIGRIMFACLRASSVESTSDEEHEMLSRLPATLCATMEMLSPNRLSGSESSKMRYSGLGFGLTYEPIDGTQHIDC